MSKYGSFDIIKKIFFTVFLCVSLTVFLTPPGLDGALSLFHLGDALKLAFGTAIVVSYLTKAFREKKIDGFLFLFIFFSTALVLGMIAGNGDLKLSLWNGILIPSVIIMLLSLSVSYDEDATVRIVYLLFLFFSFINIISVAENDYLVCISAPERIFFHNRNSHIFFYLVPMMAGYYGLRKKILRSRIVYVVALSLMMYSVIRTKALTGRVVLILWILFLLLSRLLDLSRFFTGRFSAVFHTICFAMFQMFNSENNRLISAFLELTGKSKDVSKRAPIWKKTREWIIASPFIGHGAHDMNSFINAVHPHNIYLHIMFNRGFLGLLLFILIVAFLFKAISMIKDRKTRALFGFFIFIVLLIGQFDEYNTVFYAFYGAMVFYLCRKEILDG